MAARALFLSNTAEERAELLRILADRFKFGHYLCDIGVRNIYVCQLLTCR